MKLNIGKSVKKISCHPWKKIKMQVEKQIVHNVWVQTKWKVENLTNQILLSVYEKWIFIKRN